MERNQQYTNSRILDEERVRSQNLECLRMTGINEKLNNFFEIAARGWKVALKCFKGIARQRENTQRYIPERLTHPVSLCRSVNCTEK